MTSLVFRIQGDQELVEFLATTPLNVRQAVIAKMQINASMFSRYVKDEKLSGQVLNAKSGELRAGVYARVYPAQSRITLSAGVRGDVPYAGIQEYGGQTSPHMIYATKASTLAFMQEGRMRFARSVQHPGSAMPERSYMRSSLAEKSAEMTMSVNESILGVLHANRS